MEAELSPGTLQQHAQRRRTNPTEFDFAGCLVNHMCFQGLEQLRFCDFRKGWCLPVRSTVNRRWFCKASEGPSRVPALCKRERDIPGRRSYLLLHMPSPASSVVHVLPRCFVHSSGPRFLLPSFVKTGPTANILGQSMQHKRVGFHLS